MRLPNALARDTIWWMSEALWEDELIAVTDGLFGKSCCNLIDTIIIRNFFLLGNIKKKIVHGCLKVIYVTSPWSAHISGSLKLLRS